MKRYFYHGGFDSMMDYQGLIYLYEFLLSGKIKLRNKDFSDESTNNPNLNHICLYRKNDDIDYSKLSIGSGGYETALWGWIDNCIVFIISPDVEAYLQKPEDVQGLIDEWRCYEEIPFDKVVGIALKDGWYTKYLKCESKENFKKCEELIKKINELIEFYGFFVVKSTSGFTDELDEKLNNEKKL